MRFTKMFEENTTQSARLINFAKEKAAAYEKFAQEELYFLTSFSKFIIASSVFPRANETYALPMYGFAAVWKMEEDETEKFLLQQISSLKDVKILEEIEGTAVRGKLFEMLSYDKEAKKIIFSFSEASASWMLKFSLITVFSKQA